MGPTGFICSASSSSGESCALKDAAFGMVARKPPGLKSGSGADVVCGADVVLADATLALFAGPAGVLWAVVSAFWEAPAFEDEETGEVSVTASLGRGIVFGLSFSATGEAPVAGETLAAMGWTVSGLPAGKELCGGGAVVLSGASGAVALPRVKDSSERRM